jgi:hypothetical protein
LDGGSPNWAFCAPVLNYDKIRQFTRDTLNGFIPEIRRIS